MIKYFFILLFFLNTSQASDIINITFLGTGTPRPNIDKLGPSIILKYQNDEHKSKSGLGLGIFIGKTLLEKNFASINCKNSKTRTGAEVVIKWKNDDLFKI